MSKLDGLKSKLSGVQAKVMGPLRNILLKVPVLKKLVAAQPAGAPAKPESNPTGIGEVYKEGTSGTRLGVVLVFIFFALFLYFGGGVVRDFFRSVSKSGKHLEMEKDFSKVVKKELERVSTSASVISIGHLATDTVKPDGSPAHLNVDIWVVCDNPETAKFLEDTGIRTHSLIIDVFRLMGEKKISPVTDDGREKTRAAIIEAVNKSLTHGKITDVNFYNLIIE